MRLVQAIHVDRATCTCIKEQDKSLDMEDDGAKPAVPTDEVCE